MTQNNVLTFTLDDADGLLPFNDPARKADEAAPAPKKAKTKDGPAIKKVEIAKSGQAKCQISGNKICKGELRLGMEENYRGHVSFKWLDPRCVKQQIASYSGLEEDLTSLIGWAELSSDKRAQLCEILGFFVPKDEAGSPTTSEVSAATAVALVVD